MLVYCLSIIVWVNNFQTPEIQAAFCDGNDIVHGSNWLVGGDGEWA